MRGIKEPAIMRMIESTTFTKTCWLYNGGYTHLGYCQVYHEGRREYIHRVSFTTFFGPPKHNVLHKCNTPRCWRPSHLYDGTRLDNAADRTKAGGYGGNQGTLNGQARLTWEQVDRMREEYRPGMTLREIGKRYNIDPSMVSLILSGKNWVRK